MTDNKHKKPSGRIIDVYPDEDEGDAGGALGGKINFVDFLSEAPPSRDDVLPSDQKRGLLLEHDKKNREAVDKSKKKRDHYSNVKAGRLDTRGLLAGMGQAAMENDYKPHPILAEHFFAEHTETPDPNQSRSEANEELRQELKKQYDNVYRPAYAPQYTTPTPKRPGG